MGLRPTRAGMKMEYSGPCIGAIKVAVPIGTFESVGEQRHFQSRWGLEQRGISGNLEQDLP